MIKNFHLIGLSVVILCCIYLAYREFRKINEKFINVNNQISELKQITSSNLIGFNNENDVNFNNMLKKNNNIHNSINTDEQILTNSLEEKYEDYETDSESEEDYDEYSFDNSDKKTDGENTKVIEIQKGNVNINNSYDNITKVDNDSEMIEETVTNEIYDSQNTIEEIENSTDEEIIDTEEINADTEEINADIDTELLNSNDISQNENIDNMSLYSNMIVDLKNEIDNMNSEEEEEEEDDDDDDEDSDTNFDYIENYTVKQLRSELMKYKTKIPSKVKRGDLIEMLRVELNN